MQTPNTITLSNGLTVVLMPRWNEPTFSFCLSVPVGSGTDPLGRSGLAHLLEHCYALGSSTMGPREIDLIVERLGGVRGALTTQDVTLHYCTMARAALATTLGNEADRFTSLALPAVEVAEERDVVLHEGIQRITRSAGGALVHQLLATAFECHRYRNPVVGWPHDARRLTRDDLLTCYNTHYVPANTTIALAGGFDPGEALDVIERCFGKADIRAKPVIEAIVEPEQTASRNKSVTHCSVPAPRLAVLWKVPPLDHPDTTPLLVVEAALRGDKQAIQARHWLLRDQGPFTLNIECDRIVELESRAEQAFQSIANIANGSVGEKMLASAGQTAINAVSSRLSHPASSALTLARFQATSRSGVPWLLGLPDRIAAVTAADMARVAARYLRPDRATTIRMVPA